MHTRSKSTVTVWYTMTFILWHQMGLLALQTAGDGAMIMETVVVLLSGETHVTSRLIPVEIISLMQAVLLSSLTRYLKSVEEILWKNNLSNIIYD